MTAPIANGESGSSVRTKLNTIIAEVDGLGTAADYATAAQGTKADTAQQPPSEGAFVNGDKTKLDSAQQPPSEGPFVNGDKTKLNGIATGAEVNTIESILEAGMDNDAVVLNVVSVSQGDYDAGTKINSTLYIIT